jgi:hypothetical protein
MAISPCRHRSSGISSSYRRVLGGVERWHAAATIRLRDPRGPGKAAGKAKPALVAVEPQGTGAALTQSALAYRGAQVVMVEPLTLADVQEIFRMRMLLEAEAAETAARSSRDVSLPGGSYATGEQRSRRQA